MISRFLVIPVIGPVFGPTVGGLLGKLAEKVIDVVAKKGLSKYGSSPQIRETTAAAKNDTGHRDGSHDAQAGSPSVDR